MSTSIAPAFIDLATYGEEEKQMYNKDNVTFFGLNKYIKQIDPRSYVKQCINNFPFIILLIILLYVSKY